ncbi:MAG TPA: TfoX/Sxy family protein [Candidatus Dojkabacteria bacterium]|jgi:TfoX/Sxy family transcriptional regulator of competence genes
MTDTLEAYEKAISEIPEIERKGKNLPYTSLNGHMFSLIGKDGKLGIRLSKEDKEEFEKKYKTKPFIQYGATMQGYVSIPDKLLKDTKELKKYLKKSLKYVKTLEPK